MGAPYRLLVDGAAASILARGLADVVLIGADRITANGDTANKVGSLALALAARHADVPFLVVAPETTVDAATPDGAGIVIEDRGADEVTSFRGVRTAPAGDARAQPGLRRDAGLPDHRDRHGPARHPDGPRRTAGGLTGSPPEVAPVTRP